MAQNDLNGKIFWGLADKFPAGTVSRIRVCGEKKDGRYLRDSKESLQISFPPEGKVFVPEAIQPSYWTFQVENNTRNRENGDKYTTVRQSRKLIKFSKLISVSQLNDPGSLPWEDLQKIWKNQEETFEDGIYFIKVSSVKELLGPFIKDQKGLSPKTGKEASVYEISDDLDKYLFDNDKLLFDNPDKFFTKRTEIDCMSNDQLREWFREKIQEAKTFTDNDAEITKKILRQIKASPIFGSNDLDTPRYKRVLACLDQYQFSYDELKDLFNKDGFEIIQEKIDGMRSKIRDEYESELLKEIDDLSKEKQKIEKDKTNILSEIENLKSNRDAILSEISGTKNDLNMVNAEYEKLLLQIKVNARITPDNIRRNDTIKPLAFEVRPMGKPFEELKLDDVHYFYLIERNLKRAGYDDTTIDLYKSGNDILVTAKAVFIPCLSWAYIFAQSIGSSKVYTMHIEHDWLHYRDFCNNGLLEIWSEAARDEETNYILVLDALNLTQPECGMMPLLDLISGYRPFLEGTQFGFLDNVKIFATIIPANENENIGLKLSKRQFPSWGTFADPGNREYHVIVKHRNGEPYGYFKPTDLTALFQSAIPGDSYFG